MVKDCKSDPKTGDATAECDGKWGCFHTWAIFWCALDNGGVSGHDKK